MTNWALLKLDFTSYLGSVFIFLKGNFASLSYNCCNDYG